MRFFMITCFKLLFIFTLVYAKNIILIEAESFDNHGGWVVDQQFMDQMGSPFLLAHGYGEPVADASTSVSIPKSGKYKIWVRTWNWMSPWDTEMAPGVFKIILNNKPLDSVFGVEGKSWDWQEGGIRNLPKGEIEIHLKDLTGFAGRCDAIVLTDNLEFNPPNGGEKMAQFRHAALGLDDIPKNAGEFDFVVIAGGMAGTAASLAAARLGLSVALIQDRPVLGGNNSSEIRVHALGETNLDPYPHIGNIVREIARKGGGNASPADIYQDDRKLKAVLAEANIHLFLNYHAFKIEKEQNKILAVYARNTLTSEELRFPAPLFADCTGDGTIGFLSAADFRYGREGIDETKESMAPDKSDKRTLGTSVLWYATEQDTLSIFPDCPWALDFNEQSCQYTTKATWEWESGMAKNMIYEFEYIRDYMFRAIYGNWAFLKNRSQRKSEYKNWKLEWVAFIGGKRESRRLLGDVILQQQDIQENRQFPDACFVTTWSIDLHYPQPENSLHFPGEEFLSYCEQPQIKPYAVPFRCLYSRNIGNLMMAGRNISVTHVALGTVRVMRTTGMMGEVIGMAAFICKKNNTTPRGLYQNFLEEFKQILKNGL